MIVGGAVFLRHGINPEHLGTIALGAERPARQDRPAARARRHPLRRRRRVDRHRLLGRIQPRAVLGWEWGRYRHPKGAPRFALTWVVLLVLALAIVMTGVDPVMLTEYAVIFSAVALPLTYIPILLVANDPDYMGAYRNGRLANMLGIVYLVVIMVIAIAADPADDPHERGTELMTQAPSRTQHPRPPAARQGRPPLRQRRRPRDRGRHAVSSRSSPGRATGRRRAGWLGRLAGWIGGGRSGCASRGRKSTKVDSAVAPARHRDRARPGSRRRPASALRRAHPGSGPVRTFSSLVGRKVETESGLSLGRCHDLRGELSGSKLEVVALCVGRGGVLDRLGIKSHGARRGRVVVDRPDRGQAHRRPRSVGAVEEAARRRRPPQAPRGTAPRTRRGRSSG